MAARSAAWGLAALLLAASAPSRAQTQGTFYAAFEDGLEAEQLGKWKEALGAFRRAAELRPAPAAVVFTYGNNRLANYYPYVHMARCSLELGDRSATTAHLKESLARGEPPLLREALARRLEDAAAKPAAPVPPAEEPKAVVAPPAVLQPPSPVVAEPPPLVLPEKGAPGIPAPPAPATPSKPAPQEKPPSATPGPEPLRKPDPPVRPEPPRPLSSWIWATPVLLLAGGAVLLMWRRRRPAPERFPSFHAHPKALGPYVVERLLGRGGFANTYLARHRETGEAAALKVLHAHRWEDEDMLQRFRQEAKVGALLQHPNLVPILEASGGGGESGEPPWIAMAYVEGETLEAYLKTQGPLPIPETVRIALDLAEALTHAHTFGVVHRDLKPGNVMLKDGRAMVMDLGIARVLDSATVTTTYSFLGTPLYAAPEAQKRSHVGPAADRYSLGILLFEMLTGTPPFTGETPFEILDRHRAHPLPELRVLRKDAPPALVRLVERLTQKDPDLRPEDLEVVKILKELQG